MGSLLLALIYICFISLGLPDSLLGSSWPIVHVQLNVPVSYAGIISIIIFAGTIFSSLISDKLLHRYGFGKVTAVSVALTAIGLFGFSVSAHFGLLALWSIPYGLGAGGVDCILNNYVALHYKAQHMSWLHCMWGVGASISPYIMSFSLIKLNSWNYGYLIVSLIQAILTFFIFMSLPLWTKNAPARSDMTAENASLKLKDILKIPGSLPCFFTFFTYCSLELTASLWASSYLAENRGIDPNTAASLASLFYIGITLGRAVNGFFAMKFTDRVLIRVGSGIVGLGILLLFVPFHQIFALSGFIIIGLGCAPIYPCIIHMTPDIFGKNKSQAMIGFQIAFAYTGVMIMPPLFGLIANHISIALFPPYLFILWLAMVFMHETMVKKTENSQRKD